MHALERGHRLPGPQRDGPVHYRWDRERLGGGHEQPSVRAGHQRLQDLEPPGFTGGTRSAQQQEAGLKFAQCIRANGVPDFPDPTPDGPLIDTNRMPAATSGGMSSQRRDAEVAQLRRRRPGGGGQVMRKTWLLAAAAGVAVAIAAGVVVATSGAKHAAPAAPEPPTNTANGGKGRARGQVSLAGTLTYRAQSDGSPYSVINQAQRDIHRVARARPGDLPGSGALPGERKPGGVAVRLDAYLSDRVGRGDRRRRGAAQRRSGRARIRHLSSDRPDFSSFGSATITALEKLQAALGETQNGTLTLGQAVFEPTAMRVTTLSAQLGGGAQTGQTVMQATSTTRQVQVALDASQQTDMAVGDKVTITLPNNQTTPGVVSSVGTVATCPPTSGPGGASSSSPRRPERTPAHQVAQAAPHRPSPWTSPLPTRPPQAHGTRPQFESPSPRPACPTP